MKPKTRLTAFIIGGLLWPFSHILYYLLFCVGKPYTPLPFTHWPLWEVIGNLFLFLITNAVPVFIAGVAWERRKEYAIEETDEE